MNWFTRFLRYVVESDPLKLDRLFRRATPSQSTGQIISEVEDRIGAAGADIIGRQAGQRRNRVHIYRQRYGYPIRLCDWKAVQLKDIEELGRCQGIGGPAEPITLVTALDWRETHGDRVCRHCKTAAAGKRFSAGIDREPKIENCRFDGDTSGAIELKGVK